MSTRNNVQAPQDTGILPRQFANDFHGARNRHGHFDNGDGTDAADRFRGEKGVVGEDTRMAGMIPISSIRARTSSLRHHICLVDLTLPSIRFRSWNQRRRCLRYRRFLRITMSPNPTFKFSLCDPGESSFKIRWPTSHHLHSPDRRNQGTHCRTLFRVDVVPAFCGETG